MNNKSTYLIRRLIILVFITCIWSCTTEREETLSDVTKVSLRHVGHHLLLANQDSTSVVKPVIVIDEFKYQLEFENELAIQPDSLVNQIKSSFQKSDLPQHYLVEVIQCKDNQVAYSYEMKASVENGIVPCAGRELKETCYRVTVRFTQMPKQEQSDSKLLYMLGLGVLVLLVFIIYKRNTKDSSVFIDDNFSSIGRYKFYPEQNKLIKEATEISLSKKECELLALFVAEPNQIIKRDTLMKKVWEDNGVIVGRSLDTYISKLRKKLQDDSTIKLTNIHGVGYKLEVNS